MPGKRHVMPENVKYARTADIIPPDLKQKIAQGKCVLFLGAGASLGAVDSNNQRLPSWARMVDELVGLLLGKLTPPTAAIKQELTDLFGCNELLAISEWIDANLNPLDFAQYLRNRLGTATNSKVHQILSKKNFAAVVTTNYDDLAEQYWQKAGRKPVVVTPHVSAAELSQAQFLLRSPCANQIPVIKPHGTWGRPDTLVFGPRTYREIMYNNPGFRNFMAEMFTQYTVLFVGLSFRDPNLQSLLQWVRTQTNGNMPMHYGTLENRGQVFKLFMQNNHNVRLLTYPVPPDDHSKCLTILRKL